MSIWLSYTLPTPTPNVYFLSLCSIAKQNIILVRLQYDVHVEMTMELLLT